MTESPSERRRRERAARAAAKAEGDEGSPAPSPESAPAAAPRAAPSPAAGGGGSRFRPGTGWALVAGLAIGFAVGREAYRLGLPDTRPTADAGDAVPFIAAESAGHKVYKSSAEFPAGWVKDTDLANGATLFAGLNDQQKATVMQALNERDCTCGCPFGKLAECLHKDPNCPNSPAIAKMVVDLVKQGKGLDDLLAAIDDKQKGGKPTPAAAPEAPPTPKYIEVAAWNPQKGPKDAKVTIVLFSDFQ